MDSCFGMGGTPISRRLALQASLRPACEASACVTIKQEKNYAEKNHPGSRKKENAGRSQRELPADCVSAFSQASACFSQFHCARGTRRSGAACSWIAPYDPNAIVGPFSGAPTLQNWLGTDQIGRDVLSRLLYAMRISLLVGALATLISTVIGVVLGLIAGYFGGIADMLIMRFTDMVMSFPYILLVLVAAGSSVPASGTSF